MEKAYLSGRMEDGMKESTKTIKNKEKECFIGQKEKAMKGIGIMDYSMEKELFITPTIEACIVDGRTVRKLKLIDN